MTTQDMEALVVLLAMSVTVAIYLLVRYVQRRVQRGGRPERTVRVSHEQLVAQQRVHIMTAMALAAMRAEVRRRGRD